MSKRIKKTIATVAALGSLALGGAVFAQAQSGSGPQPVAHVQAPSGQSSGEASNAPDRDNVRSGDQTTPDPAGASGGEQSSTAEAPDGLEQSGAESAPNNDGPGGHADEPANPNADYQFQGQQ